MKRLRLSGGHSGQLRAKVIDSEARDLSGLTIDWRVGLVPTSLEPYDRADDHWVAAGAEFPITGQVILSITLSDGDLEPGRYWLWVMPLGAEDEQPIKATDDVVVID